MNITQRLTLFLIIIFSFSLLVSCSNDQQTKVRPSTQAQDASISVVNNNNEIVPAEVSQDMQGIQDTRSSAVEAEIVTTMSGSVCIDSDGGVNYALIGKIKDAKGRLDNDRCSKNEFYPNRLMEFSCGADGAYVKEEYECLFGCEEGVCLTEPKLKPVEQPVVQEEAPIVPEKTIDEFIAEYTAQFTDDDFYTTFLAVKPAKQEAQINDEPVVVLRIKNKFGTQKPHYFKVHILGTAKDWVQGGRENGGYLTLGPFETQEAYLDVPLKLKIKKTHGMADEFTTKVGLEYQFRIEVAESRDSYLGYSIEDKSALFMIKVVE